MLTAEEEKKRNLHTLLMIGGAILLAGLGGFSAGRFSAPLRVETKEVEKVVYKDRVEVVEKVVTVEKAAKVETRIVWRDRIILKDGTVTEHEVEKSGATTTDEKNTAAETTRVEVREVERVKLVDKIVTLQPRWRVAVLAGAQWPAPLLPIAGPLVLGLEGDFRIIGGFSAGLWLNTGGSAGLSLALEF